MGKFSWANSGSLGGRQHRLRKGYTGALLMAMSTYFGGLFVSTAASFIDSISHSGQARHGHSCKAQLMPRLGTVTRADSAGPLSCML